MSSERLDKLQEVLREAQLILADVNDAMTSKKGITRDKFVDLVDEMQTTLTDICEDFNDLKPPAVAIDRGKWRAEIFAFLSITVDQCRAVSKALKKGLEGFTCMDGGCVIVAYGELEKAFWKLDEEVGKHAQERAAKEL